MNFEELKTCKTFSLPPIPRKNNFTLIRMFCCFIVVYEHYVVLSGRSWLILNLRSATVAVFFILSGFWVTTSFLRSSSIKEFAFKRFKKIFPLYWGIVILCTLSLVFVSSLSPVEYFSDTRFWKYLIANLSTLNFLQPTLPGVFVGAAAGGAVNGSLWTIKVEVGFYLVLPIILLIMSKIKKNDGGGTDV